MVLTRTPDDVIQPVGAQRMASDEVEFLLPRTLVFVQSKGRHGP